MAEITSEILDIKKLTKMINLTEGAYLKDRIEKN